MPALQTPLFIELGEGTALQQSQWSWYYVTISRKDYSNLSLRGTSPGQGSNDLNIKVSAFGIKLNLSENSLTDQYLVAPRQAGQERERVMLTNG